MWSDCGSSFTVENEYYCRKKEWKKLCKAFSSLCSSPKNEAIVDIFVIINKLLPSAIYP